MGMWILIAVVVGGVLWAIGMYNGLVALRNRYRNLFAQIDVQLKRRYELIPNLVESAKGYMEHERATLEAVVTARASALNAAQLAAAKPGDATAMQGLAQAESTLGGALGRFVALFEQYPDLKANQNVLALQRELSGTENTIAVAREAYNDSVMEYNTRLESLPESLCAGLIGFDPAELLHATQSAEERHAPKVSFG